MEKDDLDPLRPYSTDPTDVTRQHGKAVLQPVDDMSAYMPKADEPLEAPVDVATQVTAEPQVRSGVPAAIDRTQVYPTASAAHTYGGTEQSVNAAMAAADDAIFSSRVMAPISSRVGSLQLLAGIFFLYTALGLFILFRAYPVFVFLINQQSSSRLSSQPSSWLLFSILLPVLMVLVSGLLGIYFLKAKKHKPVNIILIVLLVVQAYYNIISIISLLRTPVITVGTLTSALYMLIPLAVFAVTLKARSDVAVDAMLENA